MKLNDKKVIFLGSLALFVLSLLKKNDDKPLEENNFAIVADVAPVKNNTGLSEVSDDKGVTDAPASVVSSAGFEKAFAGVKFSDITITRDLYHADHYTITHGISASDIGDVGKTEEVSKGVTSNSGKSYDDVSELLFDIDLIPNAFVFVGPSNDVIPKTFGNTEHILDLNPWGVRDQSEAVKQAKEKSFVFDDRLVSINGQNIDLDDKSKVTEWDMMPLIDNYGRVYNGENDVPYIPQFLIFGHVPLGWQLVYFIVDPEKSEEYRKAKEEEEKSWFEKNIDTIIGVAANLIPVAGQIASAVMLGTSAVIKGMEKAELEHSMNELNSFLGRVNGLHGYFGLVPYEWDLPAFFRNEFWLKENDRLKINQYNDHVVRFVKDISDNDYLKFFPWVYRFLGRAAIQSGERVLPSAPGSGREGSLADGVAYLEREGGSGTYPAGKFENYFGMGVIGSKYNVTIFKYKDWKMTG